MTHIDEHIIELYVLGAKEVVGRVSEIEAHLGECAGCKALAGRIRALYQEAETELRLRPGLPLESKEAVVRANVKPKKFLSSNTLSQLREPVTRFQQFQYFVRGHPVVVGTGSFAFVAGLALAVSLVIKTSSKDATIGYTHYNPNENLLEAFSKENKKLWQIPTEDLKTVQTENEGLFQVRFTVVSDLYGDGANDVVTTLRFHDDGNRVERVLRILDPEGKVTFRKIFDRPVHYLQRQYSPEFGPHALLVNDLSGSGKNEIFSNVLNNGHSPCFVVRLDAHGNEIGAYWHFGWIYGIFLVDLYGNGKKELLLAGQNDVDDETIGQFPVIAILDPAQIIQQTESSCSPGFHLPLSKAELYYIRLPELDIERVWRARGPSHLSFESDQTLVIEHRATFKDSAAAFEFVFTKDMKVQQVKASDIAMLIHSKLRDQGRVNTQIDAEYLENLKNGVRYWDGKEWRKEAVRVHNQ